MRRPRLVTLVAAWVLISGLLQWTRAATLFARWNLLLELEISLPLPYAIATAAAWGGLLVAASIGLWHMKRWARWLTLAAVTGSQAQSWLDRFLFDRSDYARLSTGFAFGLTALVLALTWGVLWRKRF